MGRSQERAVPIWEKDLEEMLAEARRKEVVGGRGGNEKGTALKTKAKTS